ncbi:hypothetical protein [Kitasatospora kifunensis]|uniref:Uncharacterized protein n=1 Tax=Kitasatospora kifunensis TaxID=58351 RepID=A0A7W7VT84_KITKI|nr:hypothetical protein [Kitasatospora kifunensis]MBB4921389.1 hypothetical protein [Kitasatospora kifunensis]
MTDNAAEFVVESLDPEDPEPDIDEQLPPRADQPLNAAADEGDAVEQSRQVPVGDDEYPR